MSIAENEKEAIRIPSFLMGFFESNGATDWTWSLLWP